MDCLPACSLPFCNFKASCHDKCQDSCLHLSRYSQEFVQSVLARCTTRRLSWQLWRSCRSSDHKASAPASCSPYTRCVLSVDDRDELRIWLYYIIIIHCISYLSICSPDSPYSPSFGTVLLFCWQAPTLVKHRAHRKFPHMTQRIPN